MAFYNEPRAFIRPEGEEEITPPCTKMRSFDSISVAHILQAKLNDHTAAVNERSAPGSPSVSDAAALLQGVSTSAKLDKAVDCLLSLAADERGIDTGSVMKHEKRPRSEPTPPGATRRRLSMPPTPKSSMRGMHSSEQPLQAIEPQEFLITGMDKPLRLLSDATLLQLKLLAAAFKLCPTPTREQIDAVAERVEMNPERVATWLQCRQVCVLA